MKKQCSWSAMLLLSWPLAKCWVLRFLTPIIVGHVPLELSRIVFYAIQHGCVFSGKVQKERPVRSPLTQGGLVYTISATWSSWAGLDRLKDLTKSYSINKKEVDDSKDILKEIGIWSGGRSVCGTGWHNFQGAWRGRRSCQRGRSAYRRSECTCNRFIGYRMWKFWLYYLLIYYLSDFFLNNQNPELITK